MNAVEPERSFTVREAINKLVPEAHRGAFLEHWKGKLELDGMRFAQAWELEVARHNAQHTGIPTGRSRFANQQLRKAARRAERKRRMSHA